jgi:metallo-beta-lactamase family protein
MPLLLKFHGALETVTGSCHFFKVKASGNIYAVDCGATQGEDDEEQLASPKNLPADCYPEKLSGIILTHAHGDHISHLPRWFQAGFRGQIFCTRQTAKLTEIALIDGMKIEKRKGRWEVDEESFEETLAALRSAKFIYPGEPEILEHNVTIEAEPTSHLLGCCAFRIKAKTGGKESSVLFTGDIGPIEHADENKSLHAERIQHEEASDYIVSESTYGNRPRSKDSQSGRKRMTKMCDMLSKAFRHGEESVVIIPAFSLQRSLDLMLDVFCAVHYHRAETGLKKSETPLIMVHSGLSWNYAQAYRDFFFDEAEGKNFFNEHSLLLKSIREAGDDEYGVLHDLIPYGRTKVISRVDEYHEDISTEILWGKAEAPFGRPTIIICGSGMTQVGPVTDLLDQFLQIEEATFVLCGYVPARSPGSQLRQLWPLPVAERAALAVKIPKDPQSGRAARAIPGDAVKCGFESLSEFYSGHADGASIIRYILGDRTERADKTRGIFLVHGEHSAREGLKGLIEETCSKVGANTPTIYCPNPHGTWFECETGLFLAKPTPTFTVSAVGEAAEVPKEWHAYTEKEEPFTPVPGLPDNIELETCVVLNTSMEAEEIADLLKGTFDFAAPEARGNDIKLRLGRLDRAHSSVLLQTDQIGDSLIKISAETRIKNLSHLSDIANIAFDWRRLLNVLGVPKELYYAGVRWCQTESEVERLLAICAPSVYGTKQRRQPVLILQAETLTHDELQSVERLLTPSVAVAVVHEQYVHKINDALGLTGLFALGRDNPIYLPIKFIAGAKRVFSEKTGVDLERLAEIVTADTYIVNAREPQISSSGQPSPLASIPDHAPSAHSLKIPEQRKPQDNKQSRASLPYALFTELAAGQKLKGKVEYVRLRKDTGAPSFMLVRLSEPNVSGMLHSSQMISGFSAEIGDEIEVYIRQVDAEKREVYFSQQVVRLPVLQFLQALGESKTYSPMGLATLLGGSSAIEAAVKAAAASLLYQSKAHGEVQAETQLDTATTIDTYNRLVHEFGLVDTQFIPSPEPAKGLTYGDIAKELGYTLDDVVNAAGHMIGEPDTYQLGMAVLPAGFTPNENSAFPLEHKDPFIRECRQRSENGWSKQLDLKVALSPDCLSLSRLAISMGISEVELLTLLAQKGIQPKVHVALSTEDLRTLSKASWMNDASP